MWDGRFDSMQRQVLAVFESPLEANSSRLFLAQQIARSYAAEYQTIFKDDPTDVLGDEYPQLAPDNAGCVMELTSITTPDDECSEGVRHGVPGDNAEYDALSSEQQHRVTTLALNAGKAVAAYERLLSCGPSRFDAFMNGDESALTEAEQRGAALFVGQGKCVDCHSGPLLSDNKYYNVGLWPAVVASAFVNDHDMGAALGLAQVQTDPLNTTSEYSDGYDGRLPKDVLDGAEGAFRTPMLRCASEHPSFMHTGQMTSLEEVVEFFNDGGHIAPGQTVEGVFGESVIEPLGLTEQEVDDLVGFLRSLDSTEPIDAELLEQP